ncbi:MAG: prolyl oligopeptidase family serine peptidase [bacterium]
MKMRIAAAILAAAAVSTVVFSQDESVYGKYAESFDYDRSAPLNAGTAVKEDSKYYTMYHVYYDGANGERVPAYLFVPKNLGEYEAGLADEKVRERYNRKVVEKNGPPWPAIFFMHFLQSDKSLSEVFAREWVTYGYAIFAIDGVFKGEREVKGRDILDPNPETTVKNIRQQITDIRRGVDFLETRADVDVSRLGYFGISMGAITGATACAVDERFDVIVLADGAAGLNAIYESRSDVPEVDKEVKKAIEKMEQAGYTVEQALEIFQQVDPIHYVGRISPRPVLMLNGKYDELLPREAMEALHEAVGEPKRVRWYDSGHILPIPNVIAETLKWFRRYFVDVNAPEKK